MACAPLLPAQAQAPVPPEVAAKAYLLLDVQSDQVLAERKAGAVAGRTGPDERLGAWLTFKTGDKPV